MKVMSEMSMGGQTFSVEVSDDDMRATVAGWDDLGLMERYQKAITAADLMVVTHAFKSELITSEFYFSRVSDIKAKYAK